MSLEDIHIPFTVIDDHGVDHHFEAISWGYFGESSFIYAEAYGEIGPFVGSEDTELIFGKLCTTAPFDTLRPQGLVARLLPDFQIRLVAGRQVPSEGIFDLPVFCLNRDPPVTSGHKWAGYWMKILYFSGGFRMRYSRDFFLRRVQL